MKITRLFILSQLVVNIMVLRDLFSETEALKYMTMTLNSLGNFAKDIRKPISETLIPEAVAIEAAWEVIMHRKEFEEYVNEPFSEKEAFEEEYKKRLPKYRVYESQLEMIKEVPIASVMGGINYAMTLKEMKEAVKDKFMKMKKAGLIISRKDFEKIKDKYFSPQTDLDRIWGAEYLKNKINESEILKKYYDVPNFVIVADNPDHLELILSFSDRLFPNIAQLKDAYVYFEKISGSGVACWDSPIVKDIGIKSGIGYNDFYDLGNIIRDKTGKYYIVDTEQNSFIFPVDAKLVSLLAYAGKRFKVINNVSEYTYEFDLPNNY